MLNCVLFFFLPQSQLSKVMKDKEESEKRVARLEEELAALKLTIT